MTETDYGLDTFSTKMYYLLLARKQIWVTVINLWSVWKNVYDGWAMMYSTIYIKKLDSTLLMHVS